MSQPMRGWSAILLFPIGPKKNKHLVEDVEIFLLVKFRRITFCGFREVDNQRLGQPSRFSDRLQQNTNLVKNVEILLSVKFNTRNAHMVHIVN